MFYLIGNIIFMDVFLTDVYLIINPQINVNTSVKWITCNFCRQLHNPGSHVFKMFITNNFLTQKKVFTH